MSISHRYRHGLVLCALVTTAMAPSALAAEDKGKEAVCRKLAIPDDPRVLPYRLEPIESQNNPSLTSGEVFLVDVDGDGSAEVGRVWWEVVDSSRFLSTISVMPHSGAEGKLVQYNGPLLSCRFWRNVVFDIWGDSSSEIVLAKHRGDTLFLEIVGFRLDDGVLANDTSAIITAAVARGFPPGEFWHDIIVEPLLATDLNGDGVRELLFTRSAKPDSAIARGIVAWDFAAGKELWFLPLADMVAGRYRAAYPTAAGETLFVVSTNATANRYECRGMDSHHAYALAFDARGRERWRRVIGGSGFYSVVIPLDVNGDGSQEAVAFCEPAFDSVQTDTILRALDPATGAVVAGFALGDLPLPRQNPNVLPTGWEEAPIAVSYQADNGRVTVLLNRRLELHRCVRGPALAFMSLGGLLPGEPLLLAAGTPKDKIAILDRNLEPLALTSQGGTLSSGRVDESSRLLLSRGPSDFELVEFQRQSMIVRLSAKYRTHLEIVLAMFLLAVVLKAATSALNWRRAAMGLPTLDHIKALVLLLDAKGRIVFMNRDPLSRELVGELSGRRPHFLQTRLGAQGELRAVLADSLSDPMQVHQRRIEQTRGADTRQLEVTVYPHVGRHNEYSGKIVVVEDLADRPMWNWRLVLGDAAQRWVHRLKHHMGTARIVLGNLVEDPQIARRLQADPEFRRQWETADKEILDGGEAATRILKFLRNSKPTLTECDLNDLVRTVASARAGGLPDTVGVSLMLHEGLPPLEADTDQVREVIDNLLSNAIMAVRGEGMITITTRPATGLQSSLEDGVVEVSVADTGAGIAADDLPRIFEPGFSKSPGGTGIGLTLVKDIVENHGGTIAAESELHRGTRLTVRLPLKRR
ncbi:MAG TPA: ATP-binding protein [candidate division Zixibacteria bacterium]|nr:ATP-binding protein [candidate division Zixibacteria bacterium]HPM37966.1 ATP-binding protein [candidate division Zixibacteria bacterium]